MSRMGGMALAFGALLICALIASCAWALVHDGTTYR